MLNLTGHIIIWGGLFAHGDGSTGLMKVVFCYALPTVVQGFGANETLHFRTTTSQIEYADDVMSTVDVLWVVALAFPDGGGVWLQCVC
jgi:hypothetical protein